MRLSIKYLLVLLQKYCYVLKQIIAQFHSLLIKTTYRKSSHLLIKTTSKVRLGRVYMADYVDGTDN